MVVPPPSVFPMHSVSTCFTAQVEGAGRAQPLWTQVIGVWIPGAVTCPQRHHRRIIRRTRSPLRSAGHLAHGTAVDSVPIRLCVRLLQLPGSEA